MLSPLQRRDPPPNVWRRDRAAGERRFAFEVTRRITRIRHRGWLTMPRVLIPTDEPNFTLGLVEGYRSLGWDVVTGTENFKVRAAHYDVVHYQWPEEY